MIRILRDTLAVPAAFWWRGAAQLDELTEWAASHQWVIPGDIREFWEATGGGMAFDTEIFPRPGISDAPEDGVWKTSEFYRRQYGLADNLVIFHQGDGASAVDLVLCRYLYFEKEIEVSHPTAEYPSFDLWYLGTIRAANAEDFGLPPLTHGVQ